MFLYPSAIDDAQSLDVNGSYHRVRQRHKYLGKSRTNMLNKNHDMKPKKWDVRVYDELSLAGRDRYSNTAMGA
jgi:hypothetical protein